MRVLIFSSVFGVSGSSIRALLIAEGLQKEGVQVAIAGYTIPATLNEQITKYVFRTDRTGMEYLAEAAKIFRSDWILGITEDVADWVIYASKIVNCKSAIDLHGIAIFEIIELGKGYGNRLNRIGKSIKNIRNVAKADLIITDPPNLYPLAKFLFGKSKVVSVIGMVDTSLFENRLNQSYYNDHEKNHVFYIGNYYKWQGIELFLKAAQMVCENANNFDFTILGSVGKKAAKNILDSPLISEGIIRILDPVSHNEVSKYMISADILVIPRPFMLSTYFGFPSKLCEYMAAGKLIIATDLSPHRWALKNPDCGILCPPTAKGISESILNYDSHIAEELGKTAREQAIYRFDYIKQCKLICKEIQERM